MSEPSKQSLERIRRALDFVYAADDPLPYEDELVRHAAAAIDEAVREEREACVRIAERDGSSHTQIGPPSGLIESKVRAQIATADRIAAAIRARSEHD